MSPRERCLKHVAAAAALLSLHVVEASAGQNEDPVVRPGVTAVKAAHVAELRRAVLMLE